MSQILTSGSTPRPAGLRQALSEPWPLECAVAPPAKPAGLLQARHGSGAGDPGRRLRGAAPGGGRPPPCICT